MIALFRDTISKMIHSLEIENLRGIRTGRLEGLQPLTILTGPNGCGKSTVLDALLIATSPTPGQAVGQAVARHPAVLGGARWLFGPAGNLASLGVETTTGESRGTRLERSDLRREDLEERLRDKRARPPYSVVTLSQAKGPSFMIAFGVDNQYVGEIEARPGIVPLVQLVDPGLPIPLHRSFTAAAKAGRRGDVQDLLARLVPDFERLEILTADDDTPALHLTSGGYSVPVGLAGDGIQAFVQLALETAVAPEGLVLLEEPEVYQHPRAIWQTARALLANMQRGVQIVLTTHSLELIDALVGESTEADRSKMALFNLLLEDGELVSSRRDGEEIVFARETLENDLR